MTPAELRARILATMLRRLAGVCADCHEAGPLSILDGLPLCADCRPWREAGAIPETQAEKEARP